MNIRAIVTGAAVAALGLTLASGSLSARADGTAQVRIGYFSPDGPSIDFYVDGGKMLSSVRYKTVSTYMQVSAASHTFVVRNAGSQGGSTPMAQVDTALAAGGFYTIAAGGKTGQIKAVSFTDGFNQPAANEVAARFVHTAPEVPGVDVALKGGKVLFSNISFLQASSYGSLGAGTYDLELREAGTDHVLFTASGVTAKAGTINSLTAVGGVGQPIELVHILDASAAGVSPQGGATAGAGGTAGLRGVGTTGLVVALMIPIWLAALAVSRRGRRAPVR